MPKGYLEHANISVTDLERSTALLVDLLGWHKRWEGPSLNNGHTIHVGGEVDYVALYTGEHVTGNFAKGHPLNHIAFVVDDLDAAEEVVKRHGLDPFNHADYEPGRRFYFFDWDGIEFEVVNYD